MNEDKEAKKKYQVKLLRILLAAITFFNKLKIVQLKTLDTRYIQITLLKLVTKKMEGEK